MTALPPLEVGLPSSQHSAFSRIAESFGLDRSAPIEPQRFEFAGRVVRTIVVHGEVWFVAADVATVLGYSASSAMTRSVEEDEKGVQIVHTPGGAQEVVVLSEPGLYSAIMRSRVDAARAFKRWVTHEVLPSIRRGGSYVAPESPEQLIARALVQAQDIIERKDQHIAALTPRAEAWDELASAEGDYAVGDAAKMLARAGVVTGPQRLFSQLAELHWTFRGSDRKWRAYAAAVDAGYLTERPQSHHHPRTGEVVVDAPQVRITIRGLERLRVRLGVLTAVEVAQ